MVPNGPIRVADGNILDDDLWAQRSFKTNGALESDLAAESGYGTSFQLTAKNSGIH